MRLLPLVICFVFLTSCVDQYDANSIYQANIVVEGMITDQPGPYLVKISKSAPVTSPELGSSSVSGVNVVIHDDQGNSETLIEKSSGNYYTSSFQGVIGRSYWIEFSTSEGEAYESSHEKLDSVGDFTIQPPVFQQNEDPSSNEQVSSTNGFNIYIDSEVLPQQENRVLWRWNGTFEIFTYPELRQKIFIRRNTPPSEPPILVPDPPACSGYTVRWSTAGAQLIGPLAPCQCCTCWVTEYNQEPLLSDPNFITNGVAKNVKVAHVEVNRRTFYDKYVLQIDQLSVSQSIYGFWSSVRAQQSNGSNLFQTPPPKLVGNLKATTSKATPVVGYFAAASIKTHTVSLLRTDVPYPLRLIDTLANSCTLAYKNSVAQKPLFW